MSELLRKKALGAHAPYTKMQAGPSKRLYKLQLLEFFHEKERRDMRRSLHEFVRMAWHIIEPGRPFIDNWHLKAICDHLEAVSRRQITRLVINVPFRTSKSTIVSVMWPAWTWAQDPNEVPAAGPNHQWLCGSYAGKLAIRDNLKMRRLITSEWYASYFAGVKLAPDQNEKTRFQNTSQGSRIAFGMTGGVMGDGGDTILIDDPHDRAGANSEAERETALTTFDEGILSRLNDPATGAIVIIMQRLHQNDLSGHVLKQRGWDHLMLPMRYEKARAKPTSIGFSDPRTVEGELLWPARFPLETVEALERGLGDYGAAGQLQQRPSPAGGGVLQTKYFQLWPAKSELPDLFFVLQSYDTAFTDKTSNDPTACTVWGIGEHPSTLADPLKAGKRFAILLDCWTEHMRYPQLRKKVSDDWQAKYGGGKDTTRHPSRRVDAILIEEKGSGQSLIQDLRQANIPALKYNPGKADKTARASLTAPFLELELFYLIESKKDQGLPVTWARPFVDQCQQFPNGEHDDMVDTFTQATIYLRDAGLLELPAIPADEPEEVDYAANRRTNPYS